jgi:putative endonuclease
MQMFTNMWLGTFERVMIALDSVASRSSKAQKYPAHLATGERGEEAALFYLMRRGFIVVAQRWKDGPLPGDVDLIGWDGDLLCFIEVKTRTSRDVATASLAVDRHKRKTLRRLASQYIRQLPEGTLEDSKPETRFDIVTVYELPGEPREIQLIPGAFGWSDWKGA